MDPRDWVADKSATLDPNAHIGAWTKEVGLGTAGLVVVALLLRSFCCSFRGRAVQDTDAPELEAFETSEGRRKRVDSVRVKAGRYVSAAPIAPADEPEAAAWEDRPKDRPREACPKKAKKQSRAARTRPL